MSAFTDEVTAAETSYNGGMGGSGWNVATFAGSIEMRFAVHGKCHFTTQDNVRGFRVMCVIGILHVRAVPPNISMFEAFSFELLREFFLVHHLIYPFLKK
jgi:hypothetical protein